MSTVTELRHGRTDWTVEDLDRIPEDGNRYELVDGVLLVSPSPVPLHQRIVFRMARTLDDRCPTGLEVFVAPLDFRPTNRRSLQPDVLVARNEDVGEKNLVRAPLLVVEVLSPSTTINDLNTKWYAYADCGVQSYWIIDPDSECVIVNELKGKKYVEIGRAKGEEELTASSPFSVTFRPTDLMR